MATKQASRLQAVVVADSFDEYFRPITLEQPRALLPIAGIPLLNYTIEFLASSGVREIFVLCRAHAEAIEAHIKSLRGKIGVDVKSLKVPSSKNMGDALRELARTDSIAQDFVLVYGDIVSNQKLIPIIQEHLIRREKDKNMLMTLLLTKATEDPEMAKLKIPLLNSLFTGTSAQAGNLSTAPSTSVTPHVSAILPIDGNALEGIVSSSPSTASSFLHMQESERAERSAAAAAASSSSSSSSAMLMGSSTSSSSNAAASNVAASNAASAANAARLGESSVYLTLASNESKLVMMDSETGQLFLYEDRASTHISPHVELDPTLFRKHRHIMIRNDLQDSGVAICSPDVLMKFEDHFDYKNISQLVRGVINDELQELKVFTAIADDNYYTRRVSSLRKYHQVTGDVLRRWAFPLVPDSNIIPGSSWSYARPGIYKEHHVHLHRDCVVHSNCAIGERSSLSSGVVVSHSTIGKNCKIGRNVKISNSFIWDNVTIEDDVTLDHAIVCDGAKIGANSVIPSGCIIGYRVVIGPHTSLAPLTKLTTFGVLDSGNAPAKPKNDDDFGDDYGSSEDDTFSYGTEEDDSASDVSEDLGPGGKANSASSTARGSTSTSKGAKTAKSVGKKENSISSNIKEIDLGVGGTGRRWILPPLPFNELYTGWETVQHIRDVLLSMQRARGLAASAAAGAGGGAKEGGGGAVEDDEPLTDLEAFSNEVASIVITYCKDPKKEVKQLALEVNALKFAHDRSFLDCMAAIFTTLLRQADPSALLKSLIVLMKRFKPVFPAFLFSTADEKELIFSIEEFCDADGNEAFAKQFTNILNKLHEFEILKEEAFLDWANEHEEDEEEVSALYKSAKAFIEWLKEEEEDEEDEEDDE